MDKTNQVADPVVEDYLGRLDAAASVLPADVRRELVEGIAEHIAEARTSGTVTSEAQVRTLLDRLGEPGEIVAAAQEGVGEDGGAGPRLPWWPATGAQPVLHRPGTGRETAAVLLMTAGSVLPIVGWLCGVVLMWTSSRWRTWEKALATVVVPGGPFGVLLIAGTFFAGGESCTGTATRAANGTETQTPDVCTHTGWSLDPAIGVPAVVAWIIVPITIGIVLLVRARRRAALEPPVLVLRAPAEWGSLEIAAVVLIGLGSILIPFVGPTTGLVCTWLSPAWTRSEKWVATGLTAVPLVLELYFLLTLVSFAFI